MAKAKAARNLMETFLPEIVLGRTLNDGGDERQSRRAGMAASGWLQ
jgi:hypothetical protein